MPLGNLHLFVVVVTLSCANNEGMALCSALSFETKNELDAFFVLFGLRRQEHEIAGDGGRKAFFIAMKNASFTKNAVTFAPKRRKSER